MPVDAARLKELLRLREHGLVSQRTVTGAFFEPSEMLIKADIMRVMSVVDSCFSDSRDRFVMKLGLSVLAQQRGIELL